MMISSRFTRWLTLVALAATVAVALPARANTWPLPPAGSNVVGENRFHVVENDAARWKRLPKNITSGSWRCCRPTRA
ncbi:L,D-transpeptidase YcfS [Enterobacter hormaechei]|nr:L,D-transpeptidase YcfS [Enterobacter hormaechei]